MRIGIVGGGVVGTATARSYIEHVDEVRIYDVVKEKSTHSLSDVMECDLVFLCLPSPQKPGLLQADISYIISFFEDLRGNTNHNFVLRSTVPVGTTAMLRTRFKLDSIVHSPEFLTARCSIVDAQIPSRNIIGAPFGLGCEAHDILMKLYAKRFPCIRRYCCTSDESEAVKLFVNSFFAVKVAFFNEIFQYACTLKIDWDLVVQMMLADGRISLSHTKVPGPDGKLGYGGECLPKDIASLIHSINEKNLCAAVMRAAHNRNKQDRENV